MKRRVWVVSEQKAGTLTQCLGVGQYFDPEPQQKIARRVPPLKRIFTPPLFRPDEKRPDIIVSCGFRSEEPVMRMKKAYGGHPFTVHLQRPKLNGFDLVFVSRHDWEPELDRRANYHSMVGVPHRVTMDRLAPLREAARRRYAPNGEQVAAIFVGGDNGAYAYDDAALRRITATVRTLAEEGWRVVLSISRRSSQRTLETLLALRGPAIEVWDREGENPYLDYLAAADAFLIAKDSITMPCEALTTGKPVYALDLTPIPGERLEKFEWFHRDLQQVLKLTRPFEGQLAAYSYTPLNETRRIAGIVAAAVAERD
ncbi:mitochondrial fission ELM1 family protein [Rhizobiaceae bacterium n13]|uniref:Mitochondrial fission ELM1 family protein n=1 Tax=Ferirhizobium litorale TaxID=2927786 RepID=A0AAE3U313_9HYPH|nr:ELM1/GtrOC1 family putative glycosyltransferase [Fererhizobium litorale]MDI7864402.1 mitochondrial fission ELM1 family protein [Fererhizobium litorale]MDI7924684.1 mitochondrial fission ELM1 family protein [Fererhizobium litorale]